MLKSVDNLLYDCLTSSKNFVSSMFFSSICKISSFFKGIIVTVSVNSPAFLEDCNGTVATARQILIVFSSSSSAINKVITSLGSDSIVKFVAWRKTGSRSEEHTSELQSRGHLV